MYTVPDSSSAGRAEDCRVLWLSLGRWFNSSLSEIFLFISIYFIILTLITSLCFIASLFTPIDVNFYSMLWDSHFSFKLINKTKIT